MRLTASTSITALRPFLSEVRCQGCRRLLFKWLPKGESVVEAKCARCGMLNTLTLST